MFISRLHQQSQRLERAAGERVPQADDAAVGAVDGAQPLPRKGIKALAVAKACLLAGIELGARQILDQCRQRKDVSLSL